ncbi:hypothetical protein D3C77_28830 [compost metagenome]|jgi:hypothetical protein
MVVNLILAAFAFMASGYSLSLMCILRKLQRDPRPAAAAVFVLLAFGIVQMSEMMSEPDVAQSTVDFLVIALIWWLVIRSAIYFRKGN